MDMPPNLQERVACSIVAAAKFEVPTPMLLAISEKENGQPGLVQQNRNGTSDIGPMQFNTAYIATLVRHGIRPSDVAARGCYPYELAAWRLRQHLTHDSGDIWTRAANYHSRTPRYNTVYRSDLITKAMRWSTWLTQQGCYMHFCAPPKADPSTTSGTTATSSLASRYVARSITAAK